MKGWREKEREKGGRVGRRYGQKKGRRRNQEENRFECTVTAVVKNQRGKKEDERE